MGERIAIVGGILVVLTIVTALSGFCMVQVYENMMGGDPFNQENLYQITGTVQGKDVTGTGASTYYKENDNLRIYDFSVDTEDSDKQSRNFHATLLCYGDGKPTDEFRLIDTDAEGIHTWTYEEDGFVYTYCIGDNCKVHSFTIQSGQCDITADII